jgi:acetolactate synthase I/II/III large subunit
VTFAPSWVLAFVAFGVVLGRSARSIGFDQHDWPWLADGPIGCTGMERSVADDVAFAVRQRGADTVFGLPGGGPNLEVVGAIEAAGMRFVLAHAETNACIMASTYGLLTGRPALAIATRGPGATNAANGVAQATLDRYPLLLITDCVAEADRKRVAHQRLDHHELLGAITKWSGTVVQGASATMTTLAALDIAAAHPAGAVHLDYDPTGSPVAPPTMVAVPLSDEVHICKAAALVGAARRPVVIVGFDAVGAAVEVRTALERFGCPVLTTYQAAGVLPEAHPQLAGLFTNGVIESGILGQADLIIAIGLDQVEPMPARWRYDVPVVSVSPVPACATLVPIAAEVIGPFAATLACLFPHSEGADPAAYVEGSAESGIGATGSAIESARPALPAGSTADAPAAAHDWHATAGAEALHEVRRCLRATAAGGFGPLELVAEVIRAAPATVTATVDAGAHFLAIMPFWPTPEPLRLLISNGLATMGFALPAAIGAALARPGEPVICLVGDGGLAMALAELETVARLNLAITIIVFNDGALSLIEVKQRANQGGDGAVRFRPVDYAQVARGMGLDATVVTSATETAAALTQGWDRPRLIDARIDPGTYPNLIAATRG